MYFFNNDYYNLSQSMDIRARDKNPSVVRVMCFIFFSFRITQVKYANKKMASNSVVIVYAVSFVIKCLQTIRYTYFQVKYS